MSDVVTLTLDLADGRSLTLTPSAAVARKVNDHFGGMMPADRRLKSADMEAAAFIISAGAKIDGKEASDISKALWPLGSGKVVVTAIQFLTLLMNGGRWPSEEEED